MSTSTNYNDALQLGSNGRYEAHSIYGEKCGWQVKLSDPSLTHAILECLRDELLIVNHGDGAASMNLHDLLQWVVGFYQWHSLFVPKAEIAA